MDLTFLKTVWYRKEVKTLLISAVIGGVVQIICRRYVINHPELFKEEYPQFFKEKNGNLKEAEPEIKNKNRNPRFRHFFPRGGGVVVIEFSSITIKVLAFLAESGLLASILTGSGVIVSKIPTSEISRILREALPQTLPDYSKKQYTLVDGEKIYLDQCDQNLKYFFDMLKDPRVSLKRKKNLTRSTLTKYLNLKTMDGCRNFILCIVFILFILSSQDVSNYDSILTNLVTAIKEGKISKRLARAIMRRLKRRGLLIPPELNDLAAY